MSLSHNHIDQMGYQVAIPKTPKRIISLVPSQTELLFDLGLDEQVVGLTKFCVHPKEKVKTKTNVGGTKKFRFDSIDRLKPDLILGNKEENYQEGIERLKRDYPVWVSDIKTIDDALNMIASIGRIVGRLQPALQMVKSIQNSFDMLQQAKPYRKVLYLIWQNPNMVAGGGTFINHLLEKAGFINMAKHLMRYPELDDDEIRAMEPDLILLSSEPYPFQKQHQEEFCQRFASAQVQLVDGQMFSWYGSRLQQVPSYFKSLNF
ncbi:MAG: helical backbone metal receptor [Bacteroidota bacterium]